MRYNIELDFKPSRVVEIIVRRNSAGQTKHQFAGIARLASDFRISGNRVIKWCRGAELPACKIIIFIYISDAGNIKSIIEKIRGICFAIRVEIKHCMS